LAGINIYNNIRKSVLKPAAVAEFIYIASFLASIMVKCFYFQFTTKLNVRPFSAPQNIFMLIGSLGVLLIILSFFLLLFNKRRKTAILLLDLFLTLLIISDTLYFRYYYNAITIPVLRQFSLVGSVGDSIRSLLKTKDLVYIIDLPVLTAGLYLINRFFGEKQLRLNLLKRLACAVVIFALGFAGFQIAYMKSASQIFPYDNNYVIKDLGILYFHYYDAKRFLKDSIFAGRKLSKDEEAQIDKFFQDKTDSGENFEGTARGKNLIIVQVEALQGFVVERKFNGKEITPNLNKLINDSIYFENFYFQIGGGNTSDAEFLSNTSLFPVRDGAVYFRFPYHTYYSLPKAVKEQGYTSYVCHANNPSFWNRTEMYKSLGFNTFFSNKNYELDETRGWGLSDVSFLRQSLDKFDTDKPFYAFMITLSSHHPYNYFDDYKNFNAGKYENTFFGNYLKAMNYADSAIGELVKELKKRDLYDNSVIVIYGDHSGIQKDYVDVLQEFLGYKLSEYEWTKLQKVPCFIRFPGMKETGKNETIGSEIDVAPTVANLLGIDFPYAIGKDLFNTPNSYAVLRNGTVVTDRYVYLSGTDEVLDNNGKPLDKDKYAEEIKEMQHRLYISDLIVTRNALKKK